MKTNNENTAFAFVAGQTAESFTNSFRAGSWDLYSYATKIATRAGGAILLTFRDYSSTTQRHKLHTRRAARALNVQLFEVPNIEVTTEGEHKENYNYLMQEARTYKAKADRARTDRTREIYGRLFAEARETARNYYNLFLRNA